MHDDVLEEARIFSQLTQGFEVINHHGNRYICIGGMLFPYNLATVVVLWTLTGSRSYEGLIIDQQLEEIKRLNPLNVSFPKDRSSMIWYIANSVKTVMSEWEPDWFDNLVKEITN